MRRIVIAGATGLVGTHLLPLFGPDDEVHVLTRGATADLPAHVVRHSVDLSTDFDLSSLPDRVDAVIVLSQSPDFRDFPEKALSIFDVNVRALLRLLDYARQAGATHFVSASSGGVYGNADVAMSEDTLIPASGSLGYYLSTKVIGEILVENYAAFMNVAVLRLFFAYGKGQKRSMLIPRLVDTMARGDPIVLVGNDGIMINPIHASDAAQACISALELTGTHKINVAGPEVMSLRQICALIGRRIGRQPIFEVKTGQSSGNLVANLTKMEELLGRPVGRLSDKLDELI